MDTLKTPYKLYFPQYNNGTENENVSGNKNIIDNSYIVKQPKKNKNKYMGYNRFSRHSRHLLIPKNSNYETENNEKENNSFNNGICKGLCDGICNIFYY